MARAADVGFRALITFNRDATALTRAVEAARPHGIAIFACIESTHHAVPLWNEAYPDRLIPWQVMNEAEEAAMQFITAGRNRFLIPYQWGGEPLMTHEVLNRRVLCPGNRDAMDLFQPAIRSILSVPGIAGVAFDGFGYQNYRRCYCPDCETRLRAFIDAHPDRTEEENEVVFFRDLWVDAINRLADYARSVRADALTTIHIWPVFTPEPLYGNRLDVDFCGQTAAWYTLWTEEKIAEYTRVIVEEANRYHARSTGVPMIGYYDKPGQFPVKDAQRLELEIRTILDHGGRRIQVGSARDVVDNEDAAAVFKRFFAPDE